MREAVRMKKDRYRYLFNRLAILIVFILCIVLFNTNNVFSWNWDWDQGHDCVETSPGSGQWGKYDYSGNWNGTYSSKDCCEIYCKLCPVYSNTGRLQETYTDLSVYGIGPVLNITRTYDSQDWANSLLGRGWIFNLGRRLIIIRNKTGEKIIGVRLETGEKNFFKENPDGTFERLTDYGVSYDLIKNPDGTYTINNIDGTKYEIRDDGKMEKIIDRNQNELVFTYNSVGCLSRITNASGNYIDFQLGPNGKIASISDNLGRTVSYGYDNNGNLISVTDLLGNTAQYVYNNNNLLVRIIDPRGNTVASLTYDNFEPPRVSTFTEKGETHTIAYYSDHTVKTDSSGNSWTYYFNDVGIIEKVIDPLGNVKQQHHNKITSTSMDWEEDLNGNRTTYTYDQYGNVTSKTDPLGNTWTYTYISGTDLLETETNPLGVVTKYEYDNNGNQTKIMRDFGGSLENTTTYTYDNKGNMLSETDPLGNIRQYEYADNGNLIKITDPLGNVTAYTYDNRGNKLTETDAMGNTTTFIYDLMDRLVSVTDPLGNSTTYTYDANGNQTSVTDANGNTTTYTYDAYNRLIQETDPLGNVTSYAYDSRDNRTGMTDANGNTQIYTYDILNRLIQRTNPLGNQTFYTYDAQGNILSITDGNGNTTTYNYDALNRIASECNPAGETTIYTYDNNGNISSIALPNGNVESRNYDRLNRVINISDSLGTIKNYTYDVLGRIVIETDAMNNNTTYSYDYAGQLVNRIDPVGNSVIYEYDNIGNIVSITDRENNKTTYVYDSLNRRISVTTPSGNTTYIIYDNIGNKLSITDSKGNKTSFTYDNANRLVNVNYEDDTTRSFTYDGVGNIISKIDQNGAVTTYSYDPYGRTTKIDYPGDNDNQYSYDAVGNILMAENNNMAISYIYDNAYRIIESNQNGNKVTYGYDISNDIRTISYPGGMVITKKYNKRKMLIRIEDISSQSIINYSYDNADRIESKTYLNGIAGNFYYNANTWITEFDYIKDSAELIRYQYSFDNEGNRVYSKKLDDLLNSEKYLYDDDYRLIEFRRGTLDNNGNIPVPITQTQYNLDELGNWSSKTSDGVSENRVHNEMNEISEIDGIVYAYDNNGNLIDDGINTYEYDYENRLIKVIRKSDNEVLGEYKYDALSRRVEAFSIGIPTKFIYDGSDVIEERNNSNEIISTYVYGEKVDEILRMDKGNNSYYFLADALGSIIALTDNAGNVLEKYEYDPYGKSNINNSSLGNLYMFTGRRFDVQTDLYYFRARHYSAEKGRFLQRDPLYGSTYSDYYGMPLNDLHYDFRVYRVATNLYEYVKSRPTYYVDPFGLQEEEKCEKYCGPDVTSWLINQMNTNKDHPVIKTSRENVWADLIPFFNIGWNIGFFTDFKNLVKAGAPWDFKASQSFKTKSCPSEGCERTVTMCGICFDYDVPGNIHYGWVGVAARIRPWFLHNRAAAAQKGGVDDPGDTVAIDIGISMWFEGKALCPSLREFQNSLRLGPKDCEKCKENY